MEWPTHLPLEGGGVCQSRGSLLLFQFAFSIFCRMYEFFFYWCDLKFIHECFGFLEESLKV